MKILFVMGNCPRHFHLARILNETGALAGLVVEKREEYIPPPPDGLDSHLKALFIRHFKERAETENRFFGADVDALKGVATVNVADAAELNGPLVWRRLEELKPDLVLSYGVHMLNAETLSRMPAHHWNIHGGLSPWYRGAITHFWPSYFLEPQMTGMTLHQLTGALDGGPFVHQTAAPLVRGDGLHDLACRAVKGFGDDLPKVISILEKNALAPLQNQKTSGKLWLGRDWRPEHLRLIYDLYANRIVDGYLDGHLERREPKLIRQF